MTATNTGTRNGRLARFVTGRLTPGADTGQLERWAAIAEEVGDTHRGLLLTRSGRLLCETWRDRISGALYARPADVAATLGREALRVLGLTCYGPGDGQYAEYTEARLARYLGEPVVYAAYHQVCYDPVAPEPRPQAPVLGPDVTALCRDADALVLVALDAGWRWAWHEVYADRPGLYVHLTRGQLALSVYVGRGEDGQVAEGAVMDRTDRVSIGVARGLEACAALAADDPRVAADWSAIVHVIPQVGRVRDLVARVGGCAVPWEQVPKADRWHGHIGERVSRTWQWSPPWERCDARHVFLDVWRPLVGENEGSPHVTPLGERIWVGCHRSSLMVTDHDGNTTHVTEQQLRELLHLA